MARILRLDLITKPLCPSHQIASEPGPGWVSRISPMSAGPCRVGSIMFSTRVLLTCAALAVAHLLLHLCTVPVLTTLAPLAPPAYALVAGVHSFMPFLARRVTGVAGSALVTSGIAALLVIPSSSSGFIAAIPVLLAGVAIDLTLWRSAGGAEREARYLAAGAVTAGVLWAVSLVVFSPEHLTPVIVIGTLVGRLGGELLAVISSRVVASALQRAGIGRGLRASDQSSPTS